MAQLDVMEWKQEGAVGMKISNGTRPIVTDKSGPREGEGRCLRFKVR